jgi:phage baseplate assembly protein W
MADTTDKINASYLDYVDDSDLVAKKLREKSLKNEYRDIDIGFNINPVTGDLIVRKNQNSIYQSIRSLIFTKRGEKLFRPTVGSDVETLLFEPLDFISERRLEEVITTSLNNYEPRISIRTVTVKGDVENQRYDVTIVFSLVNQQTEVITFNTTLDKIRG